jgi:uroporphyrin-3 C-methyltransferase
MTESDPPLLLPAPSAPPRSGRWLLVILLLVLIAGTAAGGFYLWQQLSQRDSQMLEFSQQVEQNRQQMGRLQQTLGDQMDQRLGAAQNQLEEGNRLLQQRVAELSLAQQELMQRLDGQQQRLAALATTSREDWQLAEAEYLLKIANQRLLLERDTHNATALVRSADGLIQQASAASGDAELFAVRKSLSRDLAALERIIPVDKEGVYLRLYALAGAIDQLPRVAPTRLTAPEPVPSAPVAPGTPLEKVGWAARAWGEIKSMAGQLHNYIRIDSVAAPAKPLVDSHVTQIAGLNLRLLLEQAQLAVLKTDAVVYRHSLEQAQQLLTDYYLDSPEAQQLSQKLQELLALDIAPALPDISPSFGLLHDYLRQLHQTQPKAKGQLNPELGSGEKP